MARARPALQVLLHGEAVAELRAGPALELEYAPEVVSALGIGALCLSVSLPVAAKPYRDTRPGAPRPRRAVEFWCEGLLPEGETRTMLENRFAVRRGDTVGLLAEIGADCAGAVTFVSDDRPRPAAGVAAQPLSEEQLAAAVEALPSHPLGVDEDVRASLGGLQAKLLLTRTEKGWTRPVGGQPSTHILKPDPRDLRRPGLVAAEALTLRAARLAGIAAADVELVTVGERMAVIVERYDRHRGHRGAIERVHQEDGCQAMGLDPTFAAKYQRSSDTPPSYAELARLLRTHASDVDAELVRLAQQMTLGWAVGNTDGHARNFSLLLTDGVAGLAPAYDVAPTHLFVSGTTSGLWIDGQATLRWITRGHLLREMSSWGMASDTARDVLESTLAALADALQQAADQLGELLPVDIVNGTLEHLERMRVTSDT
ncbi:MAG: HipA domain-containing protein [Actinomycetota bacterium]|jgi:serine/threonine-protein kinase HipA|nr:HipA domain-containing protein [Actinomycetota bacterium]